MSVFWVYLYLVALIVFTVGIWVYGIGLVMSRRRKLAPPVPSSRGLRDAVVSAIEIDMPNAANVLDIGSGWGGMVRSAARRFPHARVVGVEMLPVPFVYSVVAGLFLRNAKVKFGDAFKYLADKKFDVGIAYLLTPEMPDVERFLSHFEILYVLDFPLPGVKPDRKIKLHRDYLGQHYLYVYKKHI